MRNKLPWANTEHHHELAAGYEQLRQDALSVPSGSATSAGLALFLRSGMIAWLRAWSPCRPTSPIQPAPHFTAPQTAPDCPLEIRWQIANILAGLILNQQLEATT